MKQVKIKTYKFMNWHDVIRSERYEKDYAYMNPPACSTLRRVNETLRNWVRDEGENKGTRRASVQQKICVEYAPGVTN